MDKVLCQTDARLKTYVQLKAIPESFVLNPLDADNVKSCHGFAEKSFDLLKLI